jgi:hypothetical protein
MPLRCVYRAFAIVWLGACLGGTLGCARLAEMTGYNEPTIPKDAVVEHVIPTNASWQTFAAARPLGNLSARRDVERRWASPSYDTHAWLPALAGAGVEDGYSKFEAFERCKWVWYPEEGFIFGGVNAVAPGRQVVHMRREFYNAMAPGNLVDAYIDIMTSGHITARVFVNGLPARPGKLRPRALKYGATPDMAPRRYVFAEHMVYGENVIGIEATAHIAIDVGGEQVRNYVRDGLIAKVVVR